MAYSKTKKTLFILLCLFVILFPFWCVRGLCAETEEIDYDLVPNIAINSNRNYFDSSSVNVGYFLIEKGYIYHIINNSTGNRNIAYSDDIPALNGSYTYIGTIFPGDTYSIIGDSSNQYFYFDFSGTYSVTVTREKLTSMDGAVNDLVQNVGIDSIWNIFDISINYIVIVVVFALGCFVIFKLINTFSKGKEGF